MTLPGKVDRRERWCSETIRAKEFRAESRCEFIGAVVVFLRAPQMIRPCPSCGTPSPRLLEASSKDARVNYYRCPQCAHVFTVNKEDPTWITHVTPHALKATSEH
jgi:hypothetical protein